MTHVSSFSIRSLRGSVFLALLGLLTASAAHAQVSFGVSTVLAGVGPANSLVIAGANTKHLATYDATNQRLLYGVEPYLFGWQPFENVDTSGNNVGKYNSLV